MKRVKAKVGDLVCTHLKEGANDEGVYRTTVSGEVIICDECLRQNSFNPLTRELLTKLKKIDLTGEPKYLFYFSPVICYTYSGSHFGTYDFIMDYGFLDETIFKVFVEMVNVLSKEEEIKLHPETYILSEAGVVGQEVGGLRFSVSEVEYKGQAEYLGVNAACSDFDSVKLLSINLPDSNGKLPGEEGFRKEDLMVGYNND